MPVLSLKLAATSIRSRLSAVLGVKGDYVTSRNGRDRISWPVCAPGAMY